MKLDRPLQELLDQGTSDIGAKLFEQMLKEKLAEQGFKLKRASLERIAKETLDGDFGSIKIRKKDVVEGDRKTKRVSLSLDDADVDDLNERAQAFIESLPKLVQNLASKTSKDMVRLFKRQWHEDYGIRRSELDGFSERIRYGWRRGLIPLNMLLEISREYGEGRVNEELAGDAEALPAKLDVLFGLHARGCQVGAEVITLLEAGFADGAMARWRTLFELVVVATVIADGDEDTAEQYLQHNAVDALEAARRYMKESHLAAERPIPDEELERLNTRVNELCEEYGAPFETGYGWAAKLTKNKRPTLTSLINYVEKQTSLPDFKMASWNVHANARSLFFRHTNMATRSGVLSGASNAGLEDPGALTAFALSQLSALIIPDPGGAMDDVVFLHVLMRLRRKAEKGFYETAEKLMQEDEEELALLEGRIEGAELIDLSEFEIYEVEPKDEA